MPTFAGSKIGNRVDGRARVALCPGRGGVALRLVFSVLLGVDLVGLSIVILRPVVRHLAVVDVWAGLALGFAVVLGVLGVFALRMAAAELRLLRHPRPLLGFDEDGLECAAGRVRWQDVERIALKCEQDSSAYDLHVTLVPHASPVLGPSGFAWDGVSFESSELRVPLRGVAKKQALERLGVFYRGSVA